MTSRPLAAVLGLLLLASLAVDVAAQRPRMLRIGHLSATGAGPSKPYLDAFREQLRTNIPEQFRQAAVLVDRIANGAKPADIPVQQPTKFDLVINAKTAKALKLAIPASLAVRADVVE